MDLNSLSRNLQSIIEKKSIFLVIVVLLIFVVCSVVLFGDYTSKMGSYKNQILKKGEKGLRIKVWDDSKSELNKAIDFLPKSVSTDDLIAQVEDYAVQNHIEIIDTLPRDLQKLDDYISVGIRMTIRVKDFKDLVLFFYMIETSSLLLKVESFSGRIENSQTNFISCEINIASNQIKI